MKLTKEQLKVIYPQAKDDLIELHLPHINEAFRWYNMTTPERVAAFMAVCGWETGQMKYFTELGKRSYFDKYEPGTKIGKDLGNVYAGDGFKYRGRGAIQLTGRANYKAASDAFGVDFIQFPELVATPAYAWKIAGWYWVVRWKKYDGGLNYFADREDLLTIQKRVNGGMNGWEGRKALYDRILPYLRKQFQE